MSKQLTIAIDGPAGAGKSSVADALAKRLRYRYINTGLMYRAITLKTHMKAIDSGDTDVIAELAADTEIDFIHSTPKDRVILDGEDVTDLLHTPSVDSDVSKISKIPAVRKLLVDKQRKMASQGGVVIEGRDVGTVVLPDADIKFFLTASVSARARRRWDELRQKGFEVTPEDIENDISLRDIADSSRDISPLVKAEDAVEVDTTEYNLDQVVELLISIIEEKRNSES